MSGVSQVIEGRELSRQKEWHVQRPCGKEHCSFMELKKTKWLGSREGGGRWVGPYRPWNRVCLYPKSYGHPLKGHRNGGAGEV